MQSETSDHPCCHRVLLEGVGISVPLQLSLNDLQSGRYGPTVKKMVTLECAGNRRNEMAAIKLVTGRAPWNHGGCHVMLCHIWPLCQTVVGAHGQSAADVVLAMMHMATDIPSMWSVEVNSCK